MKRIGYIDARRVRYVVDGVTKFAINSWGVVVGGVAGSMSLYLAADYGAYLNSWAAGKLEMCAATEVRMRIGGKGFSVITGGQISTAYGILCTGVIDLSNGRLILDTKTSPFTIPGLKAVLWYNATTNKLEFSTAPGVKETVQSA